MGSEMCIRDSICGMRLYAGICGHRQSMRPRAAICGHMWPYAAICVLCGHVRPHVATCGHMRPHAAICHMRLMRPYAATCGRFRRHECNPFLFFFVILGPHLDWIRDMWPLGIHSGVWKPGIGVYPGSPGSIEMRCLHNIGREIWEWVMARAGCGKSYSPHNGGDPRQPVVIP